MGAPQIVQPKIREADPISPAVKYLGHADRRAGEGEFPFSQLQRIRKHQGAFGQPDERQIDYRAIRHACDQAQMLFTFGQQERDQIVIDPDRALVAIFLRSLEAKAMLVGFLD
jgi:hypothetical protein